MFRQLIAATAFTAVTVLAGCVAPASTPPATVTQPAPETSQSTDVELTATTIGPLVIGQADLSETIDYLDQALDRKGTTSGDGYCDTCAVPLTAYSWAGLDVYAAADGPQENKVLGWYVISKKAPAKLKLSSGLPFDATVAEVLAAWPGAELTQASYKTDWTITDPETGLEFLWRSTKRPAADLPAYEVSSLDLTGN